MPPTHIAGDGRIEDHHPAAVVMNQTRQLVIFCKARGCVDIQLDIVACKMLLSEPESTDGTCLSRAVTSVLHMLSRCRYRPL